MLHLNALTDKFITTPLKHSLLSKAVWFNPRRSTSGALDNAHLSKRFVNFSSLLFFLADFSYAQLGGWGVWDSTHHTSTWDGVQSGTRSGLTVPSDARAPSSTQGSHDPPVPPTEPGSALDYHLTQHDGPRGSVGQQRPACGKHYHACINQKVH